MNRMTVSLVAAGLILIAVFLAGRWILLGSMEASLAEESRRLEESEGALARVQAEHDSLKAFLASAPVQAARPWLGVGDEAGLVRGLYDAASASEVLIRKFEYLKIFHLKTDSMESGGSGQGAGTPEQLPEFDERTGQAIGAQTEEAEGDWPGVEVLPVRLELKGVFVSVVGFFLKARKTLPRFQVRSMDLTIDPSGIVKGKAILVFPLLEKSIPAAGAASGG